jgi:hypothetical protein
MPGNSTLRANLPGGRLPSLKRDLRIMKRQGFTSEVNLFLLGCGVNNGDNGAKRADLAVAQLGLMAQLRFHPFRDRIIGCTVPSPSSGGTGWDGGRTATLLLDIPQQAGRD